MAVAGRGVDAPRLVPPPSPAGWARAEIADWLEALPGTVLAGFDFSFAPPFLDRGAYLPGMETPESGPEFWAWLDVQCADADLGAGDFMAGAGRAHFWMGAADGAKADFLHFRVCEGVFNAGGGGKASTLFDCVGAAQVAKASFAGMRLLHRLRGSFAVWPFDPPGERTVVEIYTRAMLRHAGGRGLKLRDAAGLNVALAAFGSKGVCDEGLNDHQTDALLSAAALRRMAGEPKWWRPVGMMDAIARTEGWTFGVSGRG